VTIKGSVIAIHRDGQQTELPRLTRAHREFAEAVLRRGG
jgi:hypothetical protein